MVRTIRPLLLVFVLLFVHRPAASNITRGCIDNFDPSKDYFPVKVTVEDAAHFSVTYHRSYKVVSVRASVPDSQAERYVLVQCGAPTPRLEGDLAGAQIAGVPISSLYAASATHLPLLVDLQRLDVLTGVAQMKHLTGDEVLKRAASGQVREFAPVSTIDAELVVSQPPGALMTGSATSASLAVIRGAGVPVVANHEWLEPTALARAEWLKYMALFLNEERAAQQLYSEMKARYKRLSARATAVPEDRRPTIMTGRGTRGDFVIAGGRSYVAALIRDAGGRYVWADNTAEGSATIDLEAQIRRAGNADIWINGGGWPSLEQMVKDEPRYGEFTAYRSGQVWVYERRVTPAGANDYWSRAVSHPDLLLADLVRIFWGSVELGGTPLESLSASDLARRLGVVLTERVAVESLRAREIIELGRYPHSGWLGGLTDRDHEIVSWAIDAVGANHLADRDSSRMSDGERQRVMVARALAQEPVLLVLDEPTAFLDVPSRVELMGLLRRLTRGGSLAVIVSTHDLELALRTADVVWLLLPGGEVVTGAPEDVILSGGIATAFEGRQIRFHPEERGFRWLTGDRGTAAVRGDGLPAAMARAVLEREGYAPVVEPTTSDSLSLTVSEAGWHLSADAADMSGDTFRSLATHVRRLSESEYEKESRL